MDHIGPNVHTPMNAVCQQTVITSLPFLLCIFTLLVAASIARLLLNNLDQNKLSMLIYFNLEIFQSSALNVEPSGLWKNNYDTMFNCNSVFSFTSCFIPFLQFYKYERNKSLLTMVPVPKYPVQNIRDSLTTVSSFQCLMCSVLKLKPKSASFWIPSA